MCFHSHGFPCSHVWYFSSICLHEWLAWLSLRISGFGLSSLLFAGFLFVLSFLFCFVGGNELSSLQHYMHCGLSIDCQGLRWSSLWHSQLPTGIWTSSSCPKPGQQLLGTSLNQGLSATTSWAGRNRHVTSRERHSQSQCLCPH